LGTAFGIIASPIFSLLWHFLWNYGALRSWTGDMSGLEISLIKGAFLAVIALVILIVYIVGKRKTDKKEAKEQDELKQLLRDLISEMRQERYERNNKPK
jgi:hypothetical protein